MNSFGGSVENPVITPTLALPVEGEEFVVTWRDRADDFRSVGRQRERWAKISCLIDYALVRFGENVRSGYPYGRKFKGGF